MQPEGRQPTARVHTHFMQHITTQASPVLYACESLAAQLHIKHSRQAACQHQSIFEASMCIRAHFRLHLLSLGMQPGGALPRKGPAYAVGGPTFATLLQHWLTSSAHQAPWAGSPSVGQRPAGAGLRRSASAPS